MTVGKLRPLLIKQHFVFYGCTRFLNEHQSEDNSEKKRHRRNKLNRPNEKKILWNDDGKEGEEGTSSKKMQNEENTR